MTEDDFDEAEKEYNRLVPEYNRLIDYLKSVSEKFSLLQQEFNEEQVRLIYLNKKEIFFFFVNFRIMKKQQKSLMNFFNVKIMKVF
jgi:hypothetical protein